MDGKAIKACRTPLSQVGDQAVATVEPQLAVLHQAGQRGTMLGADHDLDPEPAGRLHEVMRPVGAARDQQENARHRLKLTTK